MTRYLCAALCFFGTALTAGDVELKLAGLPLHMVWTDVDGNGEQDLVALLLQTKTEGTLDTWLEDGALRGLYADQTTSEKHLETWLQHDGRWALAHRIPLAREGVLGFAVADAPTGKALMLWRNAALVRYSWADNAWTEQLHLPTPGLLAAEAASLSDFPFWYEDARDAYWIVPDLAGLQMRRLAGEDTVFLPYPASGFEDNHVGALGHRINIPLPRLSPIDGDGRPELVFTDGDGTTAYQLGASTPAYRTDKQGLFADFNGDGLADLLVGEEQDVERLKDLPTIQTHIRTYLAEAPLVFAETPTADQLVPGMLVQGDDGLQLASPTLDLNGDGRTDLAGMAFKFSIWQAGKVLVTGRMTFKFLLSLSVQNPDGSFRTLPGGPFPMVWKLNLRRLRLPSFAELTADFNGDGWTDILMEKDHKIEITPVTAAGIASRPIRRSLPRALRDPDQVYGRDLDGDGTASLVVVKFSENHTLIGILEPRP